MDRNKLITILALCGAAFGQVSSNTPSRPRRFTEFTVATLPAASGATGQTFIATDALTSGSCSSGGGSFISWCRSNGSTYDAVGDGGSAAASFDPLDTSILYYHDEFGVHTTSSGSIGELEWLLTAVTSCGTAVSIAGNYPHIGVIQVPTPATSGDGCILTHTASSFNYGDLKTNTNWNAKYIFQISSAAATSFYIGIGSNSGPPTTFIGMRFDTNLSDTNWQFETESASVADTLVDSGVAGDTAWHDLTISSTTAGEIRFQLDSGSVFCISTAASGTGCAAGSTFNATHIPTSGINATVSIVARAAAAKNFSVDFYAFKMTGLTR